MNNKREIERDFCCWIFMLLASRNRNNKIFIINLYSRPILIELGSSSFSYCYSYSYTVISTRIKLSDKLVLFQIPFHFLNSQKKTHTHTHFSLKEVLFIGLTNTFCFTFFVVITMRQKDLNWNLNRFHSNIETSFL